MAQARVVILGGGFGGLFTALDLTGDAQITLISPEDQFTFTPLLYEYLSGEVEGWHIAPTYKELLDSRVRFVQARATAIDVATREVTVDLFDQIIPYDVLVLAVGGVTSYASVEGAAEHAIPFRKTEHADRLRRLMIDTLDRIAPGSAPQDASAAATFAVVGAGASGVETATKMADLLRSAFRERGLAGEARVVIFEYGDRIVPGMEDELREHVQEGLQQSGVEVHTRARVRRVTPDGLEFEHDGAQRELKAAGVVWTGGVAVNPLIETLPFEKDRRGLIIIEPTMQVRGRSEVFALGDIARFADATASAGSVQPHVSPQLTGTAQLAFQEGGLVAANIRSLLREDKLSTRGFVEYGEAVSLGTHNAALLVGGQVVDGALARQARFALYTSRLPTWQHRLKVGASWFFEGTMPRPLGFR